MKPAEISFLMAHRGGAKGAEKKNAIAAFYFLALACFLPALAGCAASPATKPVQPLSAHGPVKEQTGGAISSILTEETGGSTVMKITATGPFKYISYMLDKHRRLVLEIEGAGNSVSSKLIPGNGGLIDHIAIDGSTKPGEVKVEGILKRPCGYDVKMDGTVLSVVFTPKPDASSAPKPKPMEKKEQGENEVDRLKAEVAFLKSRNSDLEDKLRQWKEKSAAATAVASPPPAPGNVAGILESIESWRLAWQEKDVERYGNFYDESFIQDGQDKKAWLLSKKEKFARAEGISIKTENIQVDINGNQASVKFIQDYQSGRHNDRGIKTLTMAQTSEGWKILFEKWEALKVSVSSFK
ncbi:MAG: hypothetical protein HZA01_11725 [Nitrospinae bacterium]|nr:hypothetical protein [Nitrospinota bacterium]